MLKKNEIYRTAVSGFTSEGLGVCRVDGCAVFVPNAAPDEEYDLRITHVGRHAAYGRIERILTASPDRCTRLCPDAKRCGGCDFWHLRYPAECRIKAQRVTDALNRIGGQNLPLVALTPAPTCEGYRNKAQFPVAMGKTGIEAGFFEKGTHNVVPVEHCRIQPACAEQARSAVLRYARRWSVPAYDETARTGLLRHIYVRHAEATEQVLVCLVVNGERLPHEDDLVDTLRRAVPGLRSVVLNTNTRSGNAVLGETMRTLWGDDAIEDILCGLRFRISPRSFYQVNRTQAERLYGKALAAAGLTGTETVLDLYCGTGTITLCLARQSVMVPSASSLSRQPSAMRRKTPAATASETRNSSARMPGRPPSASAPPGRRRMSSSSIRRARAFPPMSSRPWSAWPRSASSMSPVIRPPSRAMSAASRSRATPSRTPRPSTSSPAAPMWRRCAGWSGSSESWFVGEGHGSK